jgi:hypothetical protein
MRGVIGDWTLQAVGKNLWTNTRYTGWDPDQGNGVQATQDSGTYPLIRTFLVTISSKF